MRWASTVALTDSNGNSDVQYSYGPYGSLSVTGSTTNSYDYTGRESDGLGLHYYRARYYNPTTGRFISEDPTGLAGGINLYAYAGDNPLDFRDPFGLDKQKPTPQACFGGFSMPDGSCVGTDKNKQQQPCTVLQAAASQLGSLLNQMSDQAGELAFASGAMTLLAGLGEGATFGLDTPGTITAAMVTEFFTSVSFVTGSAGAIFNSYAGGNTGALSQFNKSQLVNLATTAAASHIPGLKQWADRLGDVVEKAYDLSTESGEGCQQ